mgnify:CR=1 FL=1
MNKYRIVLELDTYSDNIEEWVIDAVGDILEDDESLVSCHVENIDKFSCEA